MNSEDRGWRKRHHLCLKTIHCRQIITTWSQPFNPKLHEVHSWHVTSAINHQCQHQPSVTHLLKLFDATCQSCLIFKCQPYLHHSERLYPHQFIYVDSMEMICPLCCASHWPSSPNMDLQLEGMDEMIWIMKMKIFEAEFYVICASFCLFELYIYIVVAHFCQEKKKIRWKVRHDFKI